MFKCCPNEVRLYRCHLLSSDTVPISVRLAQENIYCSLIPFNETDTGLLRKKDLFVPTVSIDVAKQQVTV